MARFVGCNTIYGSDGEHRTPYLTRVWIGRLRLHIFHRGDADPDCHDHPWDFWTFPLTSYVEEVVDPLVVLTAQGNDGVWKSAFFEGPTRRLVRAFRLHHRPAIHCHRVLGRYVDDGTAGMSSTIEFDDRKVVTIVWQGRPRRKWGFLRNRDGAWCWTPWKRYVFEGGKHAPCQEALPTSLAAVPNIPRRDQTVAQLMEERAYWQANLDAGPGWAAAVGFAASQRDACDRELRRRRDAEFVDE